MRGHDILSGQWIDPATAERARQLRRQMTPAEQILWQALRANRLGGLHFRRQQIIGGFIVDFYCHAARLVVEVDGPIHRQQVEADQERDQILTGHGLQVQRVSNDAVLQNLPGVLERLSAVTQARACTSVPAGLFPLPREGRGLGG